MVGGEKVVVDDMGEGMMQCSDHPYRSNPGGICAFCLQEKLGKLVSSSKSNPFFPIPPSSSSSSSSDVRFGAGANMVVGDSGAASRSTKIHFLSASNHGKKNYMSGSNGNNNLVLKRSKSVAPSRPVTEGGTMDVAADSPRKKSFWSFLNLSGTVAGNNQRRPSSSSSSGESRDLRQHHYGSSSSSLAVVDGRTPGREQQVEVDSPNGSQGASSFGRKVARSRSVGCGSRSFSGDFLERISTGFGDCTLRRVESQREAKPKIVLHRIAGDETVDEHRFKERVRCGGIFGGFGMISSYSYFAEDYESASTTRSTASDLTRDGAGAGSTPHGRSRSWSWTFARALRRAHPNVISVGPAAAAAAAPLR